MGSCAGTLRAAKPLYAHSLAAILGAGIAAGALCLAGSISTAVCWKEARRILSGLVGRFGS